MPNNRDENEPKTSVIRRLSPKVQANLDDLYKSTYYSDIDNKHTLQSIKDDINASIKNIMDTNVDNVGEPNISKLYERMYMNAQRDSSTINEFERIFGDNEFVNNLSNSYLDNRWVKAIDQEIDEVLRYMPKLQEALNTIRDNVLSADSFSKDYLNLESDSPNKNTTEQFSRDIDDMKRRYELLKLTTDIYDETSKYGECFIYCVPYTKAIQRLMDRKDSTRALTVKTNYTEGKVYIEEAGIPLSEIDYNNDNERKNTWFNVNYYDGYIESIIAPEKDARDRYEQVSIESLTESFFSDLEDNSQVLNERVDVEYTGGGYAFTSTFNQDLESGGKLPVHHKFDQTLSDDLVLPKEDRANDGLINPKLGKPSNRIKEMNGCIIRKLKREQVIPIIMNDICLGYYYFELDSQVDLYENQYVTSGMVNTITGLRSNGRSEAFDSMTRREELLKSIASNLADKIDSKFVNANQDLKKEIYYILKYNDSFNAVTGAQNIRVSYIPPEDIHHFYFELDENTKRGVSDLNMSLIPAKLWVAIYITNCLAIMTRGNDKRVYYVRQTVESNISKTLLKTINEIKKANFGIRQIENINSVLNVTGRFNDYIIPRGADGQSPIEFEVMQGQNVEIKTELLNLLEESAINPTGVPIEIIQNRQSPDYAMQLTMSNSKFLRFVYSRQSDFQNLISNFFSKVYNIEYGRSEVIKVSLPPPLFINVTNTNQLIVNTNEYCENIANIYMSDSNDDVHRAKFAKALKIYFLGTYLNADKIQEIYDKSKQETVKANVDNPESIQNEE